MPMETIVIGFNSTDVSSASVLMVPLVQTVRMEHFKKYLRVHLSVFHPLIPIVTCYNFINTDGIALDLMEASNDSAKCYHCNIFKSFKIKIYTPQ